VEVVVEEPERMSLLGLFLKGALEERLPALERAAPRGELAISSPDMAVTLSCGEDRVVLRPGVPDRPRAHLRGSMEALIQVARGRIAGQLLRRQARVSGNPLALLPLARVFRESGR
jgi:hypothetical protein